MTLAQKVEMISRNEMAMAEATELFNKIGSYERTVEWIWNKYFA